MPPWMFEQEFMGVFGESDLQAFSSEDIKAAFDEEEVQAWESVHVGLDVGQQG